MSKLIGIVLNGFFVQIGIIQSNRTVSGGASGGNIQVYGDSGVFRQDCPFLFDII